MVEVCNLYMDSGITKIAKGLVNVGCTNIGEATNAARRKWVPPTVKMASPETNKIDIKTVLLYAMTATVRKLG